MAGNRYFLRGALAAAALGLAFLVLFALRPRKEQRSAVEVRPSWTQQATTEPDAPQAPKAKPNRVPSFTVLLRGTVENSEGEAVAGAQVYVVPAATYLPSGDEVTSHCRPTESTKNGGFALGVDIERPGELVCRHPDYAPFSRSTDALAEDQHLRIVLSRGAALRGRVVTLAGHPVVGAQVRARGLSRHMGASNASPWPGSDALCVGYGRTREDGRFEVAGLQEGMPYVVEAHAPGYTTVHSEWTRGDRWATPPADVGDIRMNRLLVSIVDVRAGELDLNWALLLRTFDGRRHVTYPTGYEKAYRGVPVDRFPSDIAAKLKSAGRTSFVLLAKQADAGAAASFGDAAAKLSLIAPTGEQVDVDVRMIPVGEKGWDVPQRIDLPANGLPPSGRLVVEAPSVPSGGPYWKRPLALSRAADGPRLQFRLAPSKQAGLFEATVPAGRYVLTRLSRMADPDWLKRGVFRREIEVAAGGVTRVALGLPRFGTLTVEPRYESGAPAREVGIYVRRRTGTESAGRWLVRIMEPDGCVEGSEVIEVEEPLRGDCEILVKKTGFETQILQIALGDGDAVCAPVLRRLGSR